MDLITRLRRAAFRRPRLLPVVAPEAVPIRLAVERYAREHGWPTAGSAADADVLAVIGPADGELASVVDVLARQIPAPWVRVDLRAPHKVAAVLDAVPARLADWAPSEQTGQEAAGRGDHGSAGDAADRPAAHGMPGHDLGGHGGQEMAGHGGHDLSGHADHAGHDLAGHGGEEMAGDGGHEMGGHVGHGGQEMAGHGGHDLGGHGGQEMGGHGGHDLGGHGGQEMAGHGGHDMGGHADHAGHDMGGHAGHGGHDMGGHGGHDMGPVAGLPMARRAPDRDGLKLDVLHVPLGPVLPYWPAGLRLALVVQGDVVQEAGVEVLGVADPDAQPFWDEPVLRVLAGDPVSVGEVSRRRAASYLDSLVRLLGVAGWDAVAQRCARLRDRTLAGEPGAVLSSDFAGLGRRISRSPVLRAMASGLGVLDGPAADRYGVSGPAATAAGDVVDRLVRWVRATEDDLDRLDDPTPATTIEGPRGRLDRDEPPSAALLAALPSLVVGAEVAGVRLIVASLDPDVSELALAREVTADG